MSETDGHARHASTRYRKRPGLAVTAIRLALDTAGLVYRKWGGEQRGKAGDWLVENHDGDVYTVDAESFGASYERVSPGRYVKTAPVWAVQADAAGRVTTREGATGYRAGDYLVSNDADGEDVYAVPRRTFEASYEADEADEDAPRAAERQQG